MLTGVNSTTHSPLFSVVVIAYNVERYIERCLKSVLAQDCDSFELIVVDDASTDRTLELIRACSKDDPRVSVVEKPCNEGAHLARMTGAAFSKGRYLYFLDGDDELCPHFFSLSSGLVSKVDADIYRLGCRVVQGVDGEQGCAATELALNESFGRVAGDDILLRSFSDRYGRLDTWRFVSCLYRGDICRDAFRAMTSQRLGYMEDAYEFFVVACRASTLENATDLVAQRYYLGTGRSGYGYMSREEFVKRQSEVFGLVQSVYSYAKVDGRELVKQCACWFEHVCLRTISNEWTVRLPLTDQISVVPVLQNAWGAAAALEILVPPLTGRAQWVLEDAPRIDDELLAQWRLALEPLLDEVEAVDADDAGTASLFELFHQIDELRAERDHAIREQQDFELARESTPSRKVLNVLLPPGSKLRRTISAAVRELRS